MYIYIYILCVCACVGVVLSNPPESSSWYDIWFHSVSYIRTSTGPPVPFRPCLAELISQNWRWRVQFSMAGVLTHASMRILVKCSRTWFCATDFRNSLSHLVSKYQRPFLWSFWWKEGFQKEQSIEKGSLWWFGDGFANKHKTITSAKYLEVAQREGTESIKHGESTRQSPEWMMWMLRYFSGAPTAFSGARWHVKSLSWSPSGPGPPGGNWRTCTRRMRRMAAGIVGSTVTAATVTLHQDPMMEGGRYYWIMMCDPQIILQWYIHFKIIVWYVLLTGHDSAIRYSNTQSIPKPSRVFRRIFDHRFWPTSRCANVEPPQPRRAATCVAGKLSGGWNLRVALAQLFNYTVHISLRHCYIAAMPCTANLCKS